MSIWKWGFYAAIILCGIGCASGPAPEAVVGQVIGDANGIRDDLKTLRTHTDEQGQPIIDAADNKAQRIVTNGETAQKAIAKEDKSTQKLRDDLNKKKGSIGVKLENLFWWVGVPVGLIWLGLEVGGRFLSNGPALGALKFIFGKR